MKNYGIITHYDVHNHGAVLQLTAMIRLLAKYGVKARALRFDKNYDFMGHQLKAKYDISIKSAGIYFRYLRERGLGWIRYNYWKRRTLNSFKLREDIIGDYYSESPELDGVIVGSDEVFALHTGPTPVFFGHCLPSDNVFAYAGSFGPTTVNDVERRHCSELIASGLRGMKGISVRDANSADVVEHLLGERPRIVVDPVLLYGYKDEIASQQQFAHKDYLLVYSYDNRMNSAEEVGAIRDYAKSRGLKILSPGFYHDWCDMNVNVDPVKLLAYFKNAACVVTDTFHGSVMSIITGAKFAVKTRESNHFKLSNLLGEYGLNGRIFTDWRDLQQTVECPIDYEAVDVELDKRRSDSMDYLISMIK